MDNLDKDHTITGPYHADRLRQPREKHQADSVWKADKRSVLPPGQYPASPVTIGHGCYLEMWIPAFRRPTLFS